jgi:hypothetical protein
VSNFLRILTLSRFRRQSAAARFIYRSLCVLFLLGFAGVTRSTAELASSPTPSPEPGLSFSIADFDGDLKPDLANVQAGQTDVSSTNYQIQLQLSAAGRQTFQIVAPLGGLRIVASDVNGDNALDLVLTTRWLRQPVAILLNDGHGSFSQVDPDAFPEAFGGSETKWGLIATHVPDAVAAPPQSREDACSAKKLFLDLQSQPRRNEVSDSRFRIASLFLSHLGRAPPSQPLAPKSKRQRIDQ